jgi:hypothetical protein
MDLNHIKSNEQQVQQRNNDIPVLKRPPWKWPIPRVDAGERLVKERREEIRLKALAEGTTPLGRELFRHLFWETERALQSGTLTYEEIEATTAGAVARDRSLKPEWALLIARLLKTNPEKLRSASFHFLGKLNVLMASHALRVKAKSIVGGRNSVENLND